MSSTFVQNFSIINDDHKELSGFKEINFNFKYMAWNFSQTYNLLWSIRSQRCKFKNTETNKIWPKN
jgi:hypothetical protein